MAFSSLLTALFVACLTAATCGQQNCAPRSQGEKTSDGLYILQSLVTNTNTEQSVSPQRILDKRISSCLPNEATNSNHIFAIISLFPSPLQFSFLPNPSSFFTDTNGQERRQLLRYLITMRDSLHSLESSAITDAVTVTMDSVIQDICSYVSSAWRGMRSIETDSYNNKFPYSKARERTFQNCPEMI